MTFNHLNLTNEQKELLQAISEEVELLKLINAPQELFNELYNEARHILFNPPEPEEVFHVHGYVDTRAQLQNWLANRFLYHCEDCWYNTPTSTYDCAHACHLWDKFKIDSLTYGLTSCLIKITQEDITIEDLIYDHCPKATEAWVRVFVNRYGTDALPIGTVIEILY